MNRWRIIYVWGKKSEQELYKNNQEVSYVKIGQTDLTCKDISEITPSRIKSAALKRCKDQSKTGISETARIFDCFIFPYCSGNTDDEIRNILCEDMYDFENSKRINKDLDEDDIPAGNEFVYNVKRKNIEYAIKSYSYNILEAVSKDELENIQKACAINDISIDENIPDLSNNDETKNKSLSKKSRFSFFKCGLEVGDKVRFMYGGQLAEVFSENKVKYDNEIYSLSKLTAKLMPEERRMPSEAYDGKVYFTTITGELLYDLYNKMK